MTSYFYAKTTDNFIPITVQLKEPDDSIIDPTVNVESIRFKMKRQGVDVFGLKVNSTSVVPDGTLKQVTYFLLAADLDTVGGYDAEFQVTFTNGSMKTYPTNDYIKIQINKGLSA